MEEPPVDLDGPADHSAGAEAGLGVGAVHLFVVMLWTRVLCGVMIGGEASAL